MCKQRVKTRKQFVIFNSLRAERTLIHSTLFMQNNPYLHLTSLQTGAHVPLVGMHLNSPDLGSPKIPKPQAGVPLNLLGIRLQKCFGPGLIIGPLGAICEGIGGRGGITSFGGLEPGRPTPPLLPLSIRLGFLDFKSSGIHCFLAISSGVEQAPAHGSLASGFLPKAEVANSSATTDTSVVILAN